MKLIIKTRKINISKAELKNIYEKRKLSTLKIAKIYNCYHQTILRKMKEFGIKSRKNTEANTLYPKYNFSGNLIEKAYLIGFRTGDLYIYRINKTGETIKVEGTSTIPAQIKLIENLFNKYGHIYKDKIKGFRGDIFQRVHCYVNDSFSFLLEKNRKIPKWILTNEKLFFAFLAGYIDAEGCIYIVNTKVPQANFMLSSYDKKILFQIWTELNLLNIKCPKPVISARKGYTSKKKPTPYNQDYWSLAVHSKVSLISLFNNVSPLLKHKAKKIAVKNALENIKWRNKAFANLRMEQNL